MFSPLNGDADSIRFSGDGALAKGGVTDGTHCLDVPGGNAVAGQTVWLWECNDGDYQKWSWGDATTYPYQGRLTLDAFPDLCLEQSDSQGDYPFLAPCSDSEK